MLSPPRQQPEHQPDGDLTPPRVRRALWSTFALSAASVIAIARWLQPDPHGFGTHTQLGLPPCAFHAWSGLPCPTCGLTTSFAYMARLQITSAIAANPLGLPLFALTAVAVVVALCGAVRAWSLTDTFERLRIPALAAIIAISAALSWLARLGALLLG